MGTRAGEPGYVEVICGPMFAGKTRELILRLGRARATGRRCQALRPAGDTRHAGSLLRAHDGRTLAATVVADAAALAAAVDPGAEIVGVDEAQFFGAALVPVLARLAARGQQVVAAGLDLDWRGEPFAPMAGLLADAEFVTKLAATCARCGAPAGRTQRLAVDDARILIGGAEAYEPRCRRCHAPPDQLGSHSDTASSTGASASAAAPA